MKNFLSGFFFLLLILGASLLPLGGHSRDIALTPGENRLIVVSSGTESLHASYVFHSFNFQEVKTPAGTFARLNVPGFSPRGEAGMPEIPVDSRFIEVPAGAGVSIRIISKTVTEYRLADLGIGYPVYPRQPPVPKTGDPVEFIYQSAAYAADSYYTQEPVTVEVLGTMRGVRIARLDVAPVSYNPVRNTIRVWEDFQFEIVFTHADEALTNQQKQRYGSHYFEPVFRGMLNYRPAESSSRDTISRYPVRYVIVSDPMFEDQLQPLVEWKTKKGFDVVQAYTNDPNVGSTTYSIKAYLQSLYDNATPEEPAPTFVLFVGDIAQVPAWTGQAASHVTDLYYVEYTNDLFPEIYYGRFSAQNTSQLQPQIDKTLMYEQFTMPDPSYLDEVVMIAGMDGNFGPVHGNGQINYGTINYFNEDHGLLSHTYLYPESGSNSANIIQNISDGVSFANYTAHGSPSGWADPSFTTSNIPGLQNSGKYGLLVGNCCSTSEYQVSECFAEAIVRAADKGALGYIGASNSTYWDEDYYFGVGVGAISGNPPSYEETTLGNYDRAFHDHGEPWEDWYTTMDQHIFAGNLAVTLGAPGSARYYWEAYCLMGDPSLMVYYGMPDILDASYDPLLPLGSPTFTINTVPYGYAALSMNGELLGAALAGADGVAMIATAGLTIPGMADVVVTAQNRQPFIGTVLIANPEGPYVMLNEVMMDDQNWNGLPEPGEVIYFDTELKNWGSDDAINVTAILALTGNAWVDVVDDYQEFGTIAAQDSSMQISAYEILVHDSVPDQAKVYFDLAIQDETKTSWSSSFYITLNAPALGSDGLVVVDTAGGNGNGSIDPGETFDLVLTVSNTGHCDAMNVLTTLTSSSSYISILTNNLTIDSLAYGSFQPLVFTAQISDEAPSGSAVELSFLTTSGAYASVGEYLLPVGLVFEDFETGDFSRFGWLHGGQLPWAITSESVYEGTYSAISGDIGDSQTSVLSLDMEVPTSDTISFYYKVSCEDDPYNNDYDWLAFYIDDAEQGRWDGEVSWSFAAYPVEQGTRNFKWVFSKDYSVSSGSDAAWLDYIIFPGTAQFVGTGEMKTADTDIVLYPNPAGDHVFVRFMVAQASDVTMKIMDLSGREISRPIDPRSFAAGRHTLRIDLSGIRAGIYMFSVHTGSGEIVKKIIVH